MAKVKKPFPAAGLLLIFASVSFLFMRFLFQQMNVFSSYFYISSPYMWMEILLLVLGIILLCKQRNILNVFPLALLAACGIWRAMWKTRYLVYGIIVRWYDWAECASYLLAALAWLLLLLLAILLAAKAKKALRIWWLPGIFGVLSCACGIAMPIYRLASCYETLFHALLNGRWGALEKTSLYVAMYSNEFYAYILLAISFFLIGKWFYRMARYDEIPEEPVALAEPITPEEPAVPAEPVAQQSAIDPEKTASAAAALKQYKELLDLGAITPEEYEAKKKQLLGL